MIVKKSPLDLADEMQDSVLTPKHRYSVYYNGNEGHKSFKTYQQALDYYTQLRDMGVPDLMMDDNEKQENLANNEV